MKGKKHFNLIVDPNILHKVQYVAEFYSRSTSVQISYLMESFIRRYERRKGEITDNDLREAGIIK